MTELTTALTLVAALAFALVHLFGGRLTFLSYVPRSRWLSMAGGVAVAYVFVHLLPELGEHQEAFEEEMAAGGGGLGFVEEHVYLIALLGLAAFYGLERAAKSSARRRRRQRASGASEERHADEQRVFALHIASYAVYNALVGYLLLHREDPGLQGFVFYSAAMALHFLVNDRGLEHDHGRLYRAYGRWLLAAAPLVGWGIGLVREIDPVALAALFAFLAGGVILNVLKEELPEDRESRFPAFAGGAAAYTALLLATL